MSASIQVVSTALQQKLTAANKILDDRRKEMMLIRQKEGSSSKNHTEAFSKVFAALTNVRTITEELEKHRKTEKKATDATGTASASSNSSLPTRSASKPVPQPENQANSMTPHSAQPSANILQLPITKLMTKYYQYINMQKMAKASNSKFLEQSYGFLANGVYGLATLLSNNGSAFNTASTQTFSSSGSAAAPPTNNPSRGSGGGPAIHAPISTHAANPINNNGDKKTGAAPKK